MIVPSIAHMAEGEHAQNAAQIAAQFLQPADFGVRRQKGEHPRSDADENQNGPVLYRAGHALKAAVRGREVHVCR